MAEKLFRLVIIAPDRIFYDKDVAMVEYNTVEGEVGIYAEHIPMTQIIAPGTLIITEEDGEKTAALLSGFAEVTKTKITILAEAVEWPEDIDVSRAREAKIRAERRLGGETGDLDVQRAELALKRALARLDVAGAAEQNG